MSDSTPRSATRFAMAAALVAAGLSSAGRGASEQLAVRADARGGAR